MMRFKFMVRKAKKIMKTTTNRGEYNRVRKAYLETKGELTCGFCKPNRGCNARNKGKKRYGGYKHKGFKYPSWKLVSKNRKQWMEKPLEFKTKQVRFQRIKWEYVDIEW